MSCNCNCNCKSCSPNACCIAVLVSIVVGIVVGFLFFSGNIPFIVTALWIALGIAGVALVLLVVALFVGVANPPTALSICLCKHAICLLVGIFGTIVLAIIALSTVLATGMISIIIIIALGAVFLSILLISLVSFLICVINKLCCTVMIE